MARGRFLNTSIAEDIELNSLSLESHWLYMMTIPHLDRDGLIKADTYVFFGKVCPRRPELIPRIDALIDEWAKCGLVTVYPTRDGKVAFFHGFNKNQQGMHYSREGISVLDVPPGYVRTAVGLITVEEAETQNNAKNGNDTPSEPSPDKLPTNSRPTPDEIPANINININSEVKDQSEVKAQAQGVRTAPAVLPPQDDALDPKALIADLRQRQFMYLDKDATTIAAQLIADYGWERIMEVADSVEAKHRAKIETGDKGISAPLAYMRSILAGSSNGKAQARGVSPPKQSMGEDSVDKFLARVNGKAH